MNPRQRRYDIAGWALFGVGCLAFLVQGIQAGDLFTIAGSLLFLFGVIAFLIPYTWSR